jgi:Tfp pilus assembly protein PilE
MNFKKVLIAAVVAVIALYTFLTKVDRTNPVAVATAFTKAMKAKDTSSASKFYVPEKADAWRQQTDDKIGSMRSNATEIYFERIPSAPGFTPPVTAAGKTMIVSADKSYTLEMMQLGGKWYVSSGQ